MIPSDDPYRDFDIWDAEQERKLSMRPVCECCQNHVQEDHYFCVDKYNVLCQTCWESYLEELEQDSLVWID